MKRWLLWHRNSKRNDLVEWSWKLGSMKGRAAAMRYTEARLAKINRRHILRSGQRYYDFVRYFDETEKERQFFR